MAKPKDTLSQESTSDKKKPIAPINWMRQGLGKLANWNANRTIFSEMKSRTVAPADIPVLNRVRYGGAVDESQMGIVKMPFVSPESKKTHQIEGFHLPAKEGRPTMVFFGGTNMDRNDPDYKDAIKTMASAAKAQGMGFLALDYPENCTEEKLKSYVTQVQYYMEETLQVPPNQQAYAGYSLGGYPALLAARTNPEAAGLHLTSTFSSLRQETKNAIRDQLGKGSKAIDVGQLSSLMDNVGEVRKLIQEQQRVRPGNPMPVNIVYSEHERFAAPGNNHISPLLNEFNEYPNCNVDSSNFNWGANVDHHAVILKDTKLGDSFRDFTQRAAVGVEMAVGLAGPGLDDQGPAVVLPAVGVPAVDAGMPGPPPAPLPVPGLDESSTDVSGDLTDDDSTSLDASQNDLPVDNEIEMEVEEEKPAVDVAPLRAELTQRLSDGALGLENLQTPQIHELSDTLASLGLDEADGAIKTEVQKRLETASAEYQTALDSVVGALKSGDQKVLLEKQMDLHRAAQSLTECQSALGRRIDDPDRIRNFKKELLNEGMKGLGQEDLLAVQGALISHEMHGLKDGLSNMGSLLLSNQKFNKTGLPTPISSAMLDANIDLGLMEECVRETLEGQGIALPATPDQDVDYGMGAMTATSKQAVLDVFGVEPTPDNESLVIQRNVDIPANGYNPDTQSIYNGFDAGEDGAFWQSLAEASLKAEELGLDLRKPAPALNTDNVAVSSNDVALDDSTSLDNPGELGVGGQEPAINLAEEPGSLRNSQTNLTDSTSSISTDDESDLGVDDNDFDLEADSYGVVNRESPAVSVDDDADGPSLTESTSSISTDDESDLGLDDNGFDAGSYEVVNRESPGLPVDDDSDGPSLTESTSSISTNDESDLGVEDNDFGFEEDVPSYGPVRRREEPEVDSLRASNPSVSQPAIPEFEEELDEPDALANDRSEDMGLSVDDDDDFQLEVEPNRPLLDHQAPEPGTLETKPMLDAYVAGEKMQPSRTTRVGGENVEVKEKEWLRQKSAEAGQHHTPQEWAANKQAGTTMYMDDRQREDAQVHFAENEQGGVDVTDNLGNNLQGTSIFAMNDQGQIFAHDAASATAKKESKASLPGNVPDKAVHVHHSSFLAGEEVAAAGEMTVGGDGSLKAVNNKSGHYQPGAQQAMQALEQFERQGVNMDNTQFTLHRGGEGPSEVNVMAKAFMQGRATPEELEQGLGEKLKGAAEQTLLNRHAMMQELQDKVDLAPAIDDPAPGMPDFDFSEEDALEAENARVENDAPGPDVRNSEPAMRGSYGEVEEDVSELDLDDPDEEEVAVEGESQSSLRASTESLSSAYEEVGIEGEGQETPAVNEVEQRPRAPSVRDLIRGGPQAQAQGQGQGVDQAQDQAVGGNSVRAKSRLVLGSHREPPAPKQGQSLS